MATDPLRMSGTFSSTGTSDTIILDKGVLTLSFGTGTVKLTTQESVSSAWVDVPDGSFTADTVQVIDFPVRVPLRLNCTSHSGNIDYEIRSI